MRTAIGASEALAREDPNPTAPAPTTQASAPITEAPAGRMIGKEEIMPLIEALNVREDRVNRRERQIAMRMQALDVAEQEINRKLDELARAEEKLRGTLALAQTAAEDDIDRLTNVYANMKPKQAAALFEEMAPEFAAGFLARMRPEAAAAVMAGLTPQAAYTISVVLAGRNADVPKE
ncbi:MAG: hypothetical protein N4A53_09940 [Pelagimonas sp.]|nr:hypothetical protein [Pelagimonas sp.]